MSALGRHMQSKTPCPLYPESGHVQCTSPCLLWANSGLMQCNQEDRYSITWDVIKPMEPIIEKINQTSGRNYLRYKLTDFGSSFMRACVGEKRG